MQVTVEPTALQQFRMGSDLGQSALVEHQNLIGMLDRGETVRDDQGGPVRYEVGQGILHQTLGLIVERCCGLIQNQDRRIFQDRAGNGKTLFVSVAAGTTISFFEQTLGMDTPVVRAMPNTPAAISQGITAIVANTRAGAQGLDEAELLLSAVGEVVRLDEEAQIDAVTGVSGSGPAYVFHMIETLAAAGVEQGLPADMAMQLARATVAGAGALAMQADEDPAQLRINVTSPNGTTQAALEVLMDAEHGFPALMRRAVAAAADRSRELARG